jgi:hypothetical protein
MEILCLFQLRMYLSVREIISEYSYSGKKGLKMSLLDDCIKALGEDTIILHKKETDEVFKELTRRFAFTRWGRIDWSQVKHSTTVNSASDIISVLIDKGRDVHNTVFILWDEAKLPAIKSNIHKVLSHIEEITIVSFDTWILCPADNYVIEFYHEGDITIGFSEQDK